MPDCIADLIEPDYYIAGGVEAWHFGSLVTVDDKASIC